MNYQQYIKAELLVLIPVLYFVGIGLKKSKLPDKYIPLSLGIAAILLSLTWVIATSDISTYSEFAAAIFTSVTQGILSAGASVYASQLYIQANKKQ